MTTITKMNLGQNGPLVSKLGLGCMRMSPVHARTARDRVGERAGRAYHAAGEHEPKDKAPTDWVV